MFLVDIFWIVLPSLFLLPSSLLPLTTFVSVYEIVSMKFFSLFHWLEEAKDEGEEERSLWVWKGGKLPVAFSSKRGKKSQPVYFIIDIFSNETFNNLNYLYNFLFEKAGFEYSWKSLPPPSDTLSRYHSNY